MSGNGIIAGTLPSAPITAAEMSDWRWQSIGDYAYATDPRLVRTHHLPSLSLKPRVERTLEWAGRALEEKTPEADASVLTTRLVGAWPHSRPTTEYLHLVESLFQRYPPWAVAEACGELVANLKWLPKVAELKEAADAAKDRVIGIHRTCENLLRLWRLAEENEAREREIADYKREIKNAATA